MKRVLVVVAVLASILEPAEAGQKRNIACKNRDNEKTCSWIRGRLAAANGTPMLRVWQTGTQHLFGIYSGPSVDRRSLDNENPELPAGLSLKFKPFENRAYADFEICLLEPFKPGAMQAACIESAKNIVVEKLERRF